MSLAQSLQSHKSETKNFKQTVDRINTLYNSSVPLFAEKIKALEEKIASLESIVVVAPHEDPLKKIKQNKKVVAENLSSLRLTLLAELKELLSRRPVVD
jgi:hypothetical protein